MDTLAVVVVAIVAVYFLAQQGQPVSSSDPSVFGDSPTGGSYIPDSVFDTVTGVQLPFDIAHLVQDAAAKYGVPPAIAAAVAWQESHGNQYDANGNVLTSPAGALGIFQLMPGTAAELGVDPTDAAQNIDGGVRYLAAMLSEFQGDVQLALAAYNWGPGHVSKNGYNNWPQETTVYVSSILKNAGVVV